MVQFAIIKYHNYTFMITDSPRAGTLSDYLGLYREYDVTTVVRLCEPLYDSNLLEGCGITHIDMPFEDGTVPDESILERWRETVSNHKGGVISVHCFSGLGRAPILVGDSLIRLGMDNIDAVELIRSKRNGALNSKQFQYLINHSFTPCFCFFIK